MMKIREMIGGLFMPKMETVEQAKKAYNLAFPGRRQEFALERWNELYLPEVEKAIALGDAEAFFNAITSSLFPCHGKACEKAREGIEIMLPKVLTLQQAKLYFRFCWHNDDYQFFQTRMRQRWEELSMAEFEKANTIEELKNISDNVFCKSSVLNLVFLKWLNICSTIEQTEDLWLFFSREDCPWRLNHRDEFERKRESILFVEIPKINELAKIKRYYFLAPSGSAVKIFALERWLDLCKTPEEASEAYKFAKNEACCLKAYQRAKELALAQS